MEAFEVHVKITTKWGKKMSFVTEKNYAPTGWKAFEKTRIYVNHKIADIASVELEYWKVLNPFIAHFQHQSVFANQKKEI